MTGQQYNSCDMAIIGLGRIGLPLAISAAEKNFKVLGIESNKNTVSKLCDNIVPFKEDGLDIKLEKNLSKNFFPAYSESLSSEDLSNIKYVMIAVGVHNISRRYPEPFQYDSITRVINYLHEKDCLRDRLIVLRPTQPIGSTRNVRELIDSTSGLVEGEDYYLAYMPERVLEGLALEEESNLPKIIGTFNEKSFDVANKMLIKLGGLIKRVSSPEVAEFVKLLDNSWRHTRFAFANDAALAAENVGVDVIEAITAANFDYPRNSIALPGPVSGYCLGKDPYIFEYAFRETELSRDFNSIWFYSILSSKYLLDHVISKVVGNDILIMGLSFKKNIDDYRLSHGLIIAKKLVEKGFSVSALDKDYMTNDYTILDSSLKDKIQIFSNTKDLSDKFFSTVLISIDNDDFYGMENFLVKHGKIIDLWGMYKKEKDIFKDYWSLG